MLVKPPALAHDGAVEIESAIGVCPVREDTELLAAAAAEGRPGRALDLGTGSGYVAVYLALRGWTVDALDVSERALEAARRNALRNRASVRVLRSDLYAAAEGPYDVIASNPPMRAGETELTRLVTSTLRRYPRLSNPIMRLSQPVLERRRVGFLCALARGALERLAARGRVVLVISRHETERLCALVPALRVTGLRPIRTVVGLDVVTFEREA